MPTVLPAAHAIITLDEYRRFRGIPSNDQPVDDEDNQLQELINANSLAVKDHLSRHVIAQTVSDEVFIGDGSASVFVKHCRITGAPTLSYYAGSSVYTLMDTTTYPREIDGDAGKIELLDGAVFASGQRYRVTYSTGWALASVPQSIKQAVCQLVQRSLLKSSSTSPKEGLTNESFGELSTAYDLNNWTPDIIKLLAPYRRWSIA